MAACSRLLVMLGMGIFYKTSKQLLQINAAVLALFVFGPGLSPTSQCSAGPPGNCDAPFFYYQQVALLHYLFLFAVLASCFLASQAILAVAVEDGESLEGLGVVAKWRARTALLFGIIFSIIAAGLAMSVYHYVLQIRYGMFACMPASLRFVVISADVVVAVVATSTYGNFVVDAVFGA